MKIYKWIVGTALCGGLLLLGACSDSGGGGGGGGDAGANSEKVASARSVAINSISNTVDTSVDSISTVVNNSATAEALVGTSTAEVAVASVLGQDFSAQANAIVKSLGSGSNNRIKPMMSHMPDVSGGDTIVSDAIMERLAGIMGEGTLEGDVIVYRPNVEELCGEPMTGSMDEYNSCRDFLLHVSVEQRLISDTEGTLTFKFDTFGPFVVGYASNSVYFETVLADLRDALAAIDAFLLTNEEMSAADKTDLHTFSGTLRLTMNRLDDQHGSIVVSIPQAIDISGTTNGQFDSFKVAATNKVFAMEANGLTNQASISFGLGAVALVTAIEDMDNPSIMLPMLFDLAGLEGAFEFDITNDGDVIVASNVGLGGSPMTIDVNGTEALNVSMDTMGFTVNGDQHSVTLDSDMDIALSILNVNALFADLFDSPAQQIDGYDTSLQGTLQLTAPASTVFLDHMGLASGITEITQGGPFTAIGSGHFMGNVTVNQSQCFSEPMVGDFPVMVVDCPILIQ